MRADANATIGMGHVVRCLALGRELAERGAEVHLASKSLPPVLVENAQRLGFTVSLLSAAPDAEATAEALRRLGQIDLVIVDHYELDTEWERAVRPLASKLMVVDDLESAHFCDILLNQNYSVAGADRYAGLVPAAATVLLGPAYALIRREFQRARTLRHQRGGGIRTILVSFGGFHAPRLVELVIEACTSPPLASRFAGGVLHIFGAEEQASVGGEYPFQVRGHRFSSDIAAFMAASDVAIGAGGGALWERFCVGLPSLVTILAENQRAGVEALAADGYVVNLGEVEQLDAIMLRSALCELWNDDTGLQNMSVRGKKLVDGEGAHRVAKILVP
jgi:UDP-2,4-diacetamido-2,4,6-trideoxy-beta-L-altropyranose hydrolase